MTNKELIKKHVTDIYILYHDYDISQMKLAEMYGVKSNIIMIIVNALSSQDAMRRLIHLGYMEW